MARRELDRYLTVPWATQALLKAYPQIRGEVLIDPCSGDGRMAAALAARFRSCGLNDIDRNAPAHTHHDACDARVWQYTPDWSISNPPFNCAGQIVHTAIQHAAVGVAMLLRATFGEPCKATPRAPRNGREWLTRHPPTAVLMLPRMSFTGDGETDSAPCWWFIWTREDLGIRNAVMGRPEAAGQLTLGSF